MFVAQPNEARFGIQTRHLVGLTMAERSANRVGVEP